MGLIPSFRGCSYALLYKRIEETCPRNKFSLLLWRIAVNEEKWILPEVALSISRLFLRVDSLHYKPPNVDMQTRIVFEINKILEKIAKKESERVYKNIFKCYNENIV